ncbi:MAG: hypothetical protein HKN21_01760 [Candidatus Eisenbacteria bacterium]|uniref:FlgD Ig-like domain-containing protein n=1 Tax=Eiseniibacteriota bacterium TaxID=2212470 RepID=A0A7Y2H0Z4_UNCEI|nr:hypothetical protein [Candidatus Eisenbacteria bacterium]
MRNPSVETFTLSFSLRTDAVWEHIESGEVFRALRYPDATASVTPGPVRASWDGRDDRGRPVPAGVYFVQLRSEAESTTRRLVRLK